MTRKYIIDNLSAELVSLIRCDPGDYSTIRRYIQMALDVGIEYFHNDSRKKGVVQMDKYGKVLNEFVSIREAARKTGLHHIHISRCCRGLAHSYHGYHWRFMNEMTNHEEKKEISFGQDIRSSA